VFDNHLRASARDWDMHDPNAFEFVTTWRTPIRQIEFQAAWFRRGDSSRVVAATDVSPDSLLSASTIEPLLFLQRDFDQPRSRSVGSRTSAAAADYGVQEEPLPPRGPTYRFAVERPSDSTLASIELIARGGAAGRARFATGPPPMTGPIALSDILLVQETASLPRNLAEAERTAFGRTRFPENTAVTLFWEEYGLSAADQPAVELIASRLDPPPLLRRLFGRVLGNATPDSLIIRYEESPASGAPIEPRSVTLALRGLRPGRYELSLSLLLRGTVRATTRREIQIEAQSPSAPVPQLPGAPHRQELIDFASWALHARYFTPSPPA
jgi:hypothetical protein